MVEFDPKKINMNLSRKESNPLFCISIDEKTDKVLLSKYKEKILFRICLFRLNLVFWNYFVENEADLA